MYGTAYRYGLRLLVDIDVDIVKSLCYCVCVAEAIYTTVEASSLVVGCLRIQKQR
jgi:hypothetical protein